MRVVQIGFHLDPLKRPPEELFAAWATLREVAVAAARAGPTVTVLQAADTNAVLERDGVKFWFIGTGRGRVRRWWPYRLFQAAASLRPNVIHVQGLSFPIQTRGLGRAVPGVPIMVQDHASRPPRGLRRLVHRWGLANIAAAAFTARDQVRPFIDAGVLRAERPIFEVIEGSTHFTPGDQGAARLRTGLRGDPCLLWLGHLNRNKDPVTVLEALSHAAPRLPDPHLWCCYQSAPVLAEVQGRIARDPVLAQRVHLLGPRPHGDVEPLLQAADFLVQGSHVEGSGYAVIEALACGTTPLVTDIPSFRRITREGAVGALSRPGDAESMARTLVAWSRRDRQSLRQAARAHFERELSFEAIGSQLRSAYETLVRAR